MFREKVILFFLVSLLLVLFTGALSHQSQGFAHAWFSTSAQTGVSLEADFITVEDVADITILVPADGVLKPPNGNNKQTPVADFKSKVNGLVIEYTLRPPADIDQIDPETGLKIFDIQDALVGDKVSPLAPINLSAGQNTTLQVVTFFNKTRRGVYKGDLKIVFSFDGKSAFTIIPLKIVKN